MNMKNKRVLVTGSSRGIGKATALELARLGATVVVHGRTMSDELAAESAPVLSCVATVYVYAVLGISPLSLKEVVGLVPMATPLR